MKKTMIRRRWPVLVLYAGLATVVPPAAGASNAAVVPPAALAVRPASAAQYKVSMCIGCHGIPQYRTAYPEVYRMPKLGGQRAAYLVAALQAYKRGERHYAPMQAVAASLSDQDMADLAAYYATQTDAAPDNPLY